QRGNTSNEIKKISSIALIDAELEDLSSYKLFRAFQRVLERYKNVQDKYVHQIVQFPYTVKEQQEFIINELSEKEKLSFDELFAELENRMHAIVSFLALLELINAQLVEMLDGEGINSFWISNKKIAAIEEE
ncbi:MAG: segregation/condensation protein A, partial [Saprospiraceae bacterium]